MGVVRIRSSPVSASTSPFRDATNMSADVSDAHLHIERRRKLTGCGHIKRLLALQRRNIRALQSYQHHTQSHAQTQTKKRTRYNVISSGTLWLTIDPRLPLPILARSRA